MRILAFATSLVGLALPAFAQSVGLKLTHGIDGYIEVPANPVLTPASGITVEAWITYDDTTLLSGWAWPTVVRQNLAAGMESYFLRVEAAMTRATVLRWKVVTSNAAQLSASWTFTSRQLTTWTHVAGTYDGTTARLFVNGVQVAQAAGTGPVRNAGGTLRIGKGDDATPNAGEVWNGEIDEVRLWPFARSGAEILSTMNAALVGMPGRVSTWGLDGHSFDTSGGLHGTQQGTVAFPANTLALTSFPSPGAAAFGSSTPGCGGPLDAGIAALPRVGNASFALTCTRGPASGGGVFLLARRGLTAPVNALGIGVWVDPVTFLLALGTPASVLGTASVPLVVPPDPSLQGGQLATQFVWIDACGPQGLTASNALRVTILP